MLLLRDNFTDDKQHLVRVCAVVVATSGIQQWHNQACWGMDVGSPSDVADQFEVCRIAVLFCISTQTFISAPSPGRVCRISKVNKDSLFLTSVNFLGSTAHPTCDFVILFHLTSKLSQTEKETF